MCKLSNSKIEKRAIEALENIINKHYTMDHQFNSMDKEMSWDGYIWIYKNINGTQDKSNLDDKVPVQIKGHVDEQKKYINKQSISYEVSLEDLKIYFQDRGVLYFEVFMSKDGRKKEVFYASLFPTKLKYYLESAQKKGNRKSINVVFRRASKNEDDFYVIVKQFSNESKKQGFGHEQLVQNAVKEVDMNRVKEVSATVVGVKNEYEILQRLGSGDVSFYAKIEGSPFSIPIEWHENSIYYMTSQIDNAITIAGKQYYDSYKVCADSNKGLAVIFSDNLKIDLKKHEFTFEARTDIRGLSFDAKFIMALLRNQKFEIGNYNFPVSNFQISEDMKSNLKFFMDIDELLVEIEVEYNKKFDEIPENVFRSFNNLIAIKMGKRNDLFTERAHIYNWYLEDKYIPLVIFRGNGAEKNEIINALYNEEFRVYVADKKGKHYTVPNLACIKGKVAKKLYKYDKILLERQFSDAEWNKITEDSLIIAGLNLIHAYDGDQQRNYSLLEFSKKIFEKLVNMFGKRNTYTINILQIKKRQGLLDENDRKILMKIECDNIQEQCAKNILLGDKMEMEKSYNKISKEDQEVFKTLPIYTLYMEQD